MNPNPVSAELVLVLVVMACLLVLGIVAVVIFYRVWRKERGGGAGRGRD